MRTLRLNARGPDVVCWKNFLRGRSPYSEICSDDDVFDITTFQETKEFQRAVLLEADGVVGPLTYAQAMLRGFACISDDALDETGPNWPPAPENFTPLPYTEREKLFGKFSYVSAGTSENPEAIRITSKWQGDNIVSVSLPQPVGLVHLSLFHKLIVPQVNSLFAAWVANGLWDRILTWDGSWAPRYVRGSRTVLSNHAWGTAFDINARWNQLGRVGALKGECGSVRELVQIANEHGFAWGGHYKTRLDLMHFEAVKIV